MEHKMGLYEQSFNEVSKGTQKINIRLYDEKRKKLELGDVIVFSKINEYPKKTVRVRVTGLLRFGSYFELQETVDPKLTGGKSKTVEEKVIELYEIYPYIGASEREILGILFKINNRL